MSFALISWQSVIAGTITTLAISIIMAILGVALGFTVVKPTSEHPLSGVGTAFGVWSIFSVVASLAAGGLVAGFFSGMNGQGHGFMVWATVLLVATMFGGLAIGSAVRSVGTVVRNVGSGAATVVSTVGGGISSMASGAIDHIKDSVDLSFDSDQLGDKIASVMRDTGVEHLQPEYLKDQMREARADMRSSLHQLRLDSDNYDQIIDDFVARQKQRLESITGDIDRDAAVTAVMNRRNISREEAGQTVDNALKTYQRVVDKAKHSLGEARQRFDETRDHLKVMADQARVRADKFSSTAAKSALAAGIALILGAVISCYAGMYGNRLTAGPWGDSFVIQTRAVAVPMFAPADPAVGEYERALERSMDRPMGESMNRR